MGSVTSGTNSKCDENTDVEITTPEHTLTITRISSREIMLPTTTVAKLKWRPSFVSWIAFLCCWPAFTAFYFFPSGDNQCLPVSAVALVTLGFCIISGFQVLIGRLAKGMFKPFWKSLSEHHRTKIVHELFDMMMRTVQLGIGFWWYYSQDGNLLEGTVCLDLEECSLSMVAVLTAVQYFFAMMINEMFTINNMNNGYLLHHVVTIFLLLSLNEPSLKVHVSSMYYFSIVAWIVFGGQAFCFVSPAHICYHLYPDWAIGQFASYVWVVMVKILIVAVCFVIMPIKLIGENFNKMSGATFWIIFMVTSFSIASEFYILWVQSKICHRKYSRVKNTKAA